MKITLAKLAEITGGELKGDAEYVVTAPAPVEEAGPEHVAYLTDPSKPETLQACKAGVLLLPIAAKEKAAAWPGNAIFVKNPQFAFTLFLRQLQLEKKQRMVGVDERASVDVSAKLGQYVYIGPGCVVGKEAVIGDFTILHANCYVGNKTTVGNNCILYPNVVVREECSIGNRVILHPCVVIGADGFGYVQVDGRHEKIPQIGRVVIEDDVEVGALTAIDRAALKETRIGAGTKIDNMVQIAHNVKIGRACIIVSQSGVAGSAELGDGVVLAGKTAVVDHIKIGSRAILTAGTGVMHDVEPGAVMFGAPGRPYREGMKILAIMGKLPEMYKALKEIKKKLGMGDREEKA